MQELTYLKIIYSIFGSGFNSQYKILSVKRKFYRLFLLLCPQTLQGLHYTSCIKPANSSWNIIVLGILRSRVRIAWYWEFFKYKTVYLWVYMEFIICNVWFIPLPPQYPLVNGLAWKKKKRQWMEKADTKVNLKICM